jgi:hypothetical protein
VDGANAETIDTSLTYTIFLPFGEGTFISDGLNWWAFPPA